MHILIVLLIYFDFLFSFIEKITDLALPPFNYSKIECQEHLATLQSTKTELKRISL